MTTIGGWIELCEYEGDYRWGDRTACVSMRGTTGGGMGDRTV